MTSHATNWPRPRFYVNKAMLHGEDNDDVTERSEYRRAELESNYLDAILETANHRMKKTGCLLHQSLGR